MTVGRKLGFILNPCPNCTQATYRLCYHPNKVAVHADLRFCPNCRQVWDEY